MHHRGCAQDDAALAARAAEEAAAGGARGVREACRLLASPMIVCSHGDAAAQASVQGLAVRQRPASRAMFRQFDGTCCIEHSIVKV